MAEFKETAVGYLNVDDYATFSSNEKKWVNKIIRLYTLHPSKVQIIHWPDENQGTIVARVPKHWLKVSPPRQMSDEQKAAAAERLRAMRESQEEEDEA